tara:strand:- start:1681 stop:1884 length:204 start_codon:yes stop_codon:yes gene_type:complete
LPPLCDLGSLETIAILAARGIGFSLVPRWRGLSRLGSTLSISEFDHHLCVITRTSARHAAPVSWLKN